MELITFFKCILANCIPDYYCMDECKVWPLFMSAQIQFLASGYDINLKNNEWHEIKIKPNNCFLLRTIAMTRAVPH